MRSNKVYPVAGLAEINVSDGFGVPRECCDEKQGNFNVRGSRAIITLQFGFLGRRII